jgi:hypothetical protein
VLAKQLHEQQLIVSEDHSAELARQGRLTASGRPYVGSTIQAMLGGKVNPDRTGGGRRGSAADFKPPLGARPFSPPQARQRGYRPA